MLTKCNTISVSIFVLKCVLGVLSLRGVRVVFNVFTRNCHEVEEM